jgi:hypothetical protein
MPRGDKSGNSGVKPHRARRVAESLRKRGATRAAANQIATAAMDREYSSKRTGNARKSKQAYDEEAHDSRSGQRKTNLTTKRGAAVSGASKPSAARRPSTSKPKGKTTLGAGRGGARRPRAAGDPGTHASAPQSAVGRRPPKPRKPTGTRRASTSR